MVIVLICMKMKETHIFLHKAHGATEIILDKGKLICTRALRNKLQLMPALPFNVRHFRQTFRAVCVL